MLLMSELHQLVKFMQILICNAYCHLTGVTYQTKKNGILANIHSGTFVQHKVIFTLYFYRWPINRNINAIIAASSCSITQQPWQLPHKFQQSFLFQQEYVHLCHPRLTDTLYLTAFFYLEWPFPFLLVNQGGQGKTCISQLNSNL